MTYAISSYSNSYDYDYAYQQQQASSLMSMYIREYISYLQEQYPYVNSNDCSIGGVQTSVNVSLEYIKKCMTDSQEAELLEAKLSEIPALVTNAIFGGYGNISNLTYEIDDNGNMSVSITTDRLESAIRGIQEKRKLEEEKANKLLENLDKINEALSEVMSWNSSEESSFLLSLNQNNNTFSILGIQNQSTQNNISNIISSNMNYLFQYANIFSDSSTNTLDTLNMGYSITDGLYLLNRIWNA